MAIPKPDTENKLFHLPKPQKGPVRRTLFALVRRPLEKLIGLDSMHRVYEAARASDNNFWTGVLEALNITCEIDERDHERIPAEGPLVIVANHPLGAMDGIAIMSLLRKIRPDVKIMANFLLGKVPGMRDDAIFVDPFGGEEARRANIAGMRESIAWVKDGGCLFMFPAGEVSHICWHKPVVTDPAWSDTVAGIIRKTGAPVLPAFFEGRNSVMFQMAGLVHPRLRTMLLPREVLRRSDGTVRIRVGRSISARKLGAVESDADLMAFLRLKCYILGLRDEASRIDCDEEAAEGPAREDFEPVADPEDPDELAAEVAALPKDALLMENRDFMVYTARAAQVPTLMREMGRLREIAFRAEGEGTGTPCDLDQFDDYYVHLFLWSKENDELVGAYRLGLSDEILKEHGRRGLYTHTLFKLSRGLLKRVNPGMEMGRSFVRIEYQRHHAPLLLLWKGIGAFVERHPQYNILFGPVTISNEYSTMSQQLLMRFLRENESLPGKARLARPRTRVRRKRVRGVPRKALREAMADLAGLTALISDIEEDEKGVPILIKHYLRLEAKLLAFNRDRDFSDVVDGLILVNLADLDSRVLSRYMTEEGLAAFRKFHGQPEDV